MPQARMPLGSALGLQFNLSYASDKRGASAYLKQGCRLALRSACSLTYSIFWLTVMGV